jgi:hypothetical protein
LYNLVFLAIKVYTQNNMAAEDKKGGLINRFRAHKEAQNFVGDEVARHKLNREADAVTKRALEDLASQKGSPENKG